MMKYILIPILILAALTGSSCGGQSQNDKAHSALTSLNSSLDQGAAALCAQAYNHYVAFGDAKSFNYYSANC